MFLIISKNKAKLLNLKHKMRVLKKVVISRHYLLLKVKKSECGGKSSAFAFLSILQLDAAVAGVLQFFAALPQIICGWRA